MTKAQALAAMNALESAAMPGSAALSYPGGIETWSIALDTTHVYTGPQVSSIASYAATNGLTLTATFSAFGLS